MSTEPVVTLIAVVSKDGYISRGKGVPWQLPKDKAHFRSYTTAKALLVGRNTYEEMLGWFTPQHKVYVLTSGVKRLAGAGRAVRSVQEAIQLARRAREPELVVCGGGQCYAEAYPFAQQLVLTLVEDVLGSGVPFPLWQEDDWLTTLRMVQPADEDHSHSMSFLVMQRAVPHAVPAASLVHSSRSEQKLKPVLQPVATQPLRRGGYFQR